MSYNWSKDGSFEKQHREDWVKKHPLVIKAHEAAKEAARALDNVAHSQDPNVYLKAIKDGEKRLREAVEAFKGTRRSVWDEFNSQTGLTDPPADADPDFE